MKKAVKKVLAAICAAALVIGCIAITAFAAAPEWTCTNTFTKKGTAFIPATTGTKYAPITLDVTDSLKNMLGTKDSVKAVIRFDYKVTLKEGVTSVNTPNTILKGTLASGATYAGEHFALQGGTAYWPKSRDNKDAYPKLVIDGKAHTYSNEITLTKADIENFSKIELVLWKIENIENFAAIEFSNTSVAVLDENTLVWEKANAPAHPTFYNDENGDVVFRQTAPTAGYQTLQCNLVSKLKELRGGLNEAAVKITFSFRADLIDTNVKVTGHVTARTVGSYSGNILNGTNNAMLKDEYQKKNCPITGEWQTVSITIPVTEKETSLNSFGLCFSEITNIGNISAIEYKNAKV